MLGQRVLTALILAPIFIAAIYLLPIWGFALLFALVVLVGAHEWAGLGRLSGAASWGYVLSVAIVLGMFWLVLQGDVAAGAELRYSWLLAALAAWVVALIMVLSYGRTSLGALLSAGPVLIFGLVLLPGAWLSLLALREQPQGSHLILLAFVLVWLADAGAYFAGRAFGRHKLAPLVSPGKTLEGALGGVISALLVIGLSLWALGWLPVTGRGLFSAGLFLLVLVSIVGDLFESVLKRSAGVKDSGQLLPGHGGVLDRVDSLLAVLPLFAVMVLNDFAPAMN